jgi:hypothetical protein
MDSALTAKHVNLYSIGSVTIFGGNIIHCLRVIHFNVV